MAQIKSWIFLVLAVLTFDSAAFDKAMHKAMGKHAAQIYCECVDRPTCPKEEFAQGAYDEDEEDKLSRMRNWHFYDAGHMTRRTRWLETTLGKILLHRLEQLEAAPADDRWYRAGRVAHYIQDMGAPAHVIPVYHASIFWPFSVEDSFDSYALKAYPEGVPNIKTKDLCPATVLNDARNIIDHLAHDTLAAVNRPILPDASSAKVRELTWMSQFWCPPTEACRSTAWAGFGTYRGPHGGQSWGVPIDLGCGEHCTVGAPHYRAFFDARYEAVLRETIRWLAFVDRTQRETSR